MRLLEVKRGTDRNNPCRVDTFMAFIIVPLHMLEIDRLTHARPLSKYGRSLTGDAMI